ncbi:hypothetical protein ACF1BQ_036595 [Bradyrhizobium sp. RDT10]
MDEKIKAKLQAALNKRHEADNERAQAELAETQRSAQREIDRAATDAEWPNAVLRMKTAIDSVNAEIEDSDMAFEVGKFERAGDENKYGGFSIHLKPASKKDRYIHLNVSDVGDVKPVFLLPHSGKSPHSFQLATASVKFYEAMLTDFFTQVIDFESKRPR